MVTTGEVKEAIGIHSSKKVSVHNIDESGKSPPQAHTHNVCDLCSGMLDGNRLPAISTNKKGSVPPTGEPIGKFLKDYGVWEFPISVGTTPPLTPNEGDLWVDTS